MWAIKLRGVGNKVGARKVRPKWPLQNGETLMVEDHEYEDGMVLDTDGATLRHLTSAEIQVAQGIEDQLDANDAEVRADNAIKVLISKSPAEINDYIDSNVTDLVAARSFLKKLTKVVSLLARKIY